MQYIDPMTVKIEYFTDSVNYTVETALITLNEYAQGAATLSKNGKHIKIIKSGSWWYETTLLSIDEKEIWNKRINDSLRKAGEKMTKMDWVSMPVEKCGWYSDLQKTKAYEPLKLGDKTMMRKVKLIVIDHDEKLDLLNKIVYESSDYFWTDKSNETVFFEADLANVIKKHNEYRKGKNLPEKQWSDLSRTVHVQVSV